MPVCQATRVASTSDAELLTRDGERLGASVLPGPGDDWVVLAHGFSGARSKDGVRRVGAALSAHCPVLSFDFRGHGTSTGLTTLGDREVHDVDAAVERARSLGARRVVTVGFSMGGATVLRHGALGEALPDAVVSVSATSRWFVRDTAAMRRLHRVVETRRGRALARALLKTRVSGAGWDPLPASPLEVVGSIQAPLLLVHGDRDHYFGLEHARALHAAAPGSELWEVCGFGHAESAADPELLDRLGRHLPVLLDRAGVA